MECGRCGGLLIFLIVSLPLWLRLLRVAGRLCERNSGQHQRQGGGTKNGARHLPILDLSASAEATADWLAFVGSGRTGVNIRA